MQPETVRSVATRLQSYFEWYVRTDPDVSDALVALVSRFSALSTHDANRAEARSLLEAMRGFSLGSPFEELRFALARLATA